MSLYFLDTNVLIDLSGEKQSRSFFEKIVDISETRLASTIICISEFIAGAKASEIKFLKGWIQSGELEIFFLNSMELAFQAAEIRKRDLLALPDSLILASVIQVKGHLLTHDKTFLEKAKKYVSASDPFEKG